MSRLIDADTLIDNMVDYVADGYAISRIDFESYTKMVQTAPTIDAVEVVRCKECVKRMREDCPMCNGCKLDRVPTEDDDYCSYGERKEKSDE